MATEEGKMIPTEEALVDEINAVKKQEPDLGMLKLLKELLGRNPDWALSEKRLRKVMQKYDLMIRTPSGRLTPAALSPGASRRSSEQVRDIDTHATTVTEEGQSGTSSAAQSRRTSTVVNGTDKARNGYLGNATLATLHEVAKQIQSDKPVAEESPEKPTQKENLPVTSPMSEVKLRIAAIEKKNSKLSLVDTGAGSPTGAPRSPRAVVKNVSENKKPVPIAPIPEIVGEYTQEPDRGTVKCEPERGTVKCDFCIIS